MNRKFNLANEVPPGHRRVWVISHQPQVQTKPVLLELREFVVDRTDTTPISMTRLVGRINTIADKTQLIEDAKTLLVRVGRVDQFIGIHE